MKKLLLFLSIVILINFSCSEGDKFKYEFPFLNQDLSVDNRVDDLIGRMTIEEKISQMINAAPAIDRLHIPEYDWWNEALHGVARAGQATVFPQAIGLAATFDEKLMLKVATAISDEGRAKHHYFVKNGNRDIYTGLTFWSPNINIFRDPRWGRGQETYGEDPFLTGRMAVNFVNGLQGNDPKYLKTVATIKHYAVHSGPEFSRHRDNFDVSNKDLMETYLAAFEMTVKETKVKSVMCAYNRFRDKPCCGSDLLLQQLLRDRFGFDGYIVSDCGAINDFYEKTAHNYVETKAEAAGDGVRAGTDIECGRVYAALMEALEKGLVSNEEIDRSLKRLFKTRFELGMFDPDSMVKYTSIPYEVVGSKEHLKLTLETAKQSLVLLKNDGILPLKKNKKIAVIGPNSNNQSVLLGNYFGQPIHPVTVLEGIRESISAENVKYAEGCPIVPGMYANHIPVPSSLFFHEENGEQKPGLVASYFDNNNLEGEPSLKETEANIDKIYEVSPIDQTIGGEFSVKWEGILIPNQTGKYDFDGVSLKIDGENPPEEGITLQKGKSYTIEASTSFKKAWYANVIRPTARLAWTRVDIDLEKEALNVAKSSDIIIFCGGISSNLEGEEMPIEVDGFSHGDRTSIKLPSIQKALLKKLKATGKPIVYVNFSGSAIALNWEENNVSAIVQAFYPGEAAGTVIAELLFGDYSPSGKLPVTFYKSVKDLPDFSDYNMTNRTYKFYEGSPLYPFGYGLSYSNFEFDNLQVPESVKIGGDVNIKVDISNTGDFDGMETVQAYITLPSGAKDASIRSLKGLKKVVLKKGEKKTVEISLKADDFKNFSDDGELEGVTGKAMISVGNGQPLEHKGINYVEKEISLTL